MAVSRMSEREVTFDVPDEWEVPDLASVVPDGGRVETATHDLTATYYDTSTSTLRHLGMTLRHRDGGPDAGWHLKVPSGSGATRTEIHSQAAAAAVPDSLTTRIAGVTGGLAVSAVATIDTTRRVTRVLAARHRLVLEVADDLVTGTRIAPIRGGRDASESGAGAGAGAGADSVSWREVEVELGTAGTEDELAAVADLFLASGAAPAAVSRKINHVLGEPPERERSGVPGAVAAYLETQCAAVLVGDVRCRDETTAAAIHDFRVAIRRLRSTMRTMGEQLDVDGVSLERFGEDLRWLAGLLSPVRDGDVLGQRLRVELEQLPARDIVGPVRDEIRRVLTTDRKDALERWQEGWRDDRYRRVMATCRDWYASVPVRGAAPEDGPSPEQVAKRALTKASRKLDHRLAAAEDDHELHQARKSAKRLRYLGDELWGELAGAKRAAKRAKRTQRALGEHQDLVVTGEFLRRMARSQVHNGFTYGLLAGRLELRAAQIAAEVTGSG